MKVFFVVGPVLVLAATAVAYPGMEQTLEEVKARLTGRKSSELLGDLVTRGPTSDVGSIIEGILTGSENPESSESWSGDLPSKDSDSCKEDTCCIWRYLANEMLRVFRGPGGRCNAFARQAVRLGFHDAGAWEKGASHGGADGSIVLSAEEMARRENLGLQTVGRLMQSWYDRYKKYGTTMADIIQMGATVGAVECPLGPRVRSFVGRKDNPTAAVEGLIPRPIDSADTLIVLFERKTISAHGLVALVGAHTTSQQQFFDTERQFDPQDSTPGVWDVLFYDQTLGTEPAPPRVITFPSDSNLASDPRTSGEWEKFAGPDNINELTECTKVLPPFKGSFDPQENEALYEEWLQGEHDEISLKLLEGDFVELT
ncbi:class II peroxidase [Zalerion maritima]|uniref:Peroxidase n=1 Tax=Zalerion maritima TaxID=339359 RepID=A0AAD5WUI7_9PEZI|nr:class II peroxidase [Zalerion maritima]